MSAIRTILIMLIFNVKRGKMIKVLFLFFTLLFIAACSDETQKVEDHVWKEQTDMIDKAKEVELLLNDAALQQRELIEQNTQ